MSPTLPRLRRCCCLPLQPGCVLLTVVAMALSAGAAAAGARGLAGRGARAPEDNFILMTAVMFSALSLLSLGLVLLAIRQRRPGYLQFGLLLLALALVCGEVVGGAALAWSPALAAAPPAARAAAAAAALLGAGYNLYFLVALNSLYRVMKGEHPASALPA